MIREGLQVTTPYWRYSVRNNLGVRKSVSFPCPGVLSIVETEKFVSVVVPVSFPPRDARPTRRLGVRRSTDYINLKVIFQMCSGSVKVFE